ncbi:MAG: hypothetical protein ABI625_04320 [bacterium]
MDDVVYLLSPARSDGARARMLLNPTATFDLAVKLRSTDGAPLGEIFSFLSGLYFRGKLEYACAHTDASQQQSRIKIITSNRGLCSPLDQVTHDDLATFSTVDIAGGDPRYLAPLERDVERLARTVADSTNIVLLGSIATGKYVDTLLEKFGERLLFPADFVGRGDMSRGGLLLRHARARALLAYTPVLGAVRHGKRPPRLDPVPRRS